MPEIRQLGFVNATPSGRMQKPIEDGPLADLQGALGGQHTAALPTSVAAETVTTGDTIKTVSEPMGLVRKGQDRLGKERTIGLSKTAFKVVTADTKGALFVMENLMSKRGGPPLHLHHNEDEYFYVLEGEFIVESVDMDSNQVQVIPFQVRGKSRTHTLSLVRLRAVYF